jgi:hypothetical protein
MLTINTPRLSCRRVSLFIIYYYFYYYGSTALCWALAAFSVSWSYTQPVGLFGWGISPSQGLYLHTEQHKYRINAHNSDIHALSGIRTHDPNVITSEDSSCLRPRGHCVWLTLHLLSRKDTHTHVALSVMISNLLMRRISPLSETYPI